MFHRAFVESKISEDQQIVASPGRVLLVLNLRTGVLETTQIFCILGDIVCGLSFNPLRPRPELHIRANLFLRSRPITYSTIGLTPSALKNPAQGFAYYS